MSVISKRLHTIADFIPNGAKVADIGSDHAYLPTYLVQSGKSHVVIAGEVNEGPYQSALKQIRETGLQEFVTVRKGNGLEVLQLGEVDTIVIAGMGGSLIVQILTDGLEKLSEVKKLVLQPNVGEELVRKFAIENGWELIDEAIIEEDQRIYEILSFKRGDALKPYRDQNIALEALLKFGPFLLQKQGDILNKKWQRELQKIEIVMKQLQQSQHPTSIDKQEQIKREYNMIKEMLH